MPKVFTFEGLDGSGKTSLIAALTPRLHSVSTYRDPGGCGASEAIRTILKSHDNIPRSAQLMLFGAARDCLYREKLEFNLSNFVLIDRWIDSTLVYQYTSRSAIHGLAPKLKIDKTFLLDTPVDVCMARCGGKDVYERVDERIWTDRRHRYLNLAREEPDRWIVLDGNKSTEELAEIALRVICE